MDFSEPRLLQCTTSLHTVKVRVFKVVPHQNFWGDLVLISVPWSLWPRDRAAAATCGCGGCELPAILRVTFKIARDCDINFCGRRSKKPSDFCNGMVAGPLAATVVTAILRCDFVRWHTNFSSLNLRSEKLQNESSPNFSNHRHEFCPEFCSEFSANF